MKFEDLMENKAHYMPDTRGGIMLRMNKIIQDRLRGQLSLLSFIDSPSVRRNLHKLPLEFLIDSNEFREDPYSTYLERRLVSTIIKRQRKLSDWKEELLGFFEEHLLGGSIKSKDLPGI